MEQGRRFGVHFEDEGEIFMRHNFEDSPRRDHEPIEGVRSSANLFDLEVRSGHKFKISRKMRRKLAAEKRKKK
jgi:hypothetical protein